MDQPRCYEEFFEFESDIPVWDDRPCWDDLPEEGKRKERKGRKGTDKEPASKKSKNASGKRSAGKRNKELGRRGEEAAADFLRRRGFLILDRNWTCFAGEADIVAMDGDALVFVEVKTRRGIDKGFPADAVNEKKRRKYENIALAYVQQHYVGEVAVRFDVVSVVAVDGGRALIRHHPGAFCGC